MCKKYKISDRIIYDSIKNGEIKKRKRKSDAFEAFSKNSELFFYTLGLVASDGYLYEPKHRIEIGLHIRETEFLKTLSTLIYDAERVYIDNIRNRVRLMLQEAEVYDLFKSYGLFQKKSESLKMDISLIPKEFFHHFLRGYIDGDGNYLYRNINNVHLRIDGNEWMMTHIKEYVQRYYRIESKVYAVKTSSSFQMFRWTIQKTPYAKQLLNILYFDANIYMERKYNIVKNVLSAV